MRWAPSLRKLRAGFFDSLNDAVQGRRQVATPLACVPCNRTLEALVADGHITSLRNMQRRLVAPTGSVTIEDVISGLAIE